MLDVRFGGPTASERAHAAARHVDMPTEVEDDDARSGRASARAQRADVVVKVAGRPTDLETVIAAADGATVVSRAALGRLLRAPAPTSPAPP